MHNSYIAILCLSVCVSVTLSFYVALVICQNDSTHRQTRYTIQQNYYSIYLTPNIVSKFRIFRTYLYLMPQDEKIRMAGVPSGKNSVMIYLLVVFKWV